MGSLAESFTGTIVRINPNEVHIDDPEYYETIYSNKPYDKLLSFENRFNMPHATFMTAHADVHKRRRNAVAPFFATNKVRGHGPFIQSLVDKISQRMTDEYSGQKKPLVLNDVFGCLSGDVITNLAFARSYHLIESQKWESPFTTAVSNLVHTSHWTTQFVWIIPLMNCIPDKVVMALSPIFKPIVEFRLVSLLVCSTECLIPANIQRRWKPKSEISSAEKAKRLKKRRIKHFSRRFLPQGCRLKN